MIVDPITEEIRELRRSLAARHGNDLDRIYEDLRKSEQLSGRQFVSLPRRPVGSTVAGLRHVPSLSAVSVALAEPSPPTP